MNTTKLVLIPKVESPVSATQLDLFHTVVLPRIIDQSQGAVVSGRELIFNVLMCQEVARGDNRKHVSHRCMIKIDLKKAYDLVY